MQISAALFDLVQPKCQWKSPTDGIYSYPERLSSVLLQEIEHSQLFQKWVSLPKSFSPQALFPSTTQYLKGVSIKKSSPVSKAICILGHILSIPCASTTSLTLPMVIGQAPPNFSNSVPTLFFDEAPYYFYTLGFTSTSTEATELPASEYLPLALDIWLVQKFFFIL